ncbi:hypothetical protein NQ317_001082 [Molorchus minor]|uniref:Uncharacterized protein n=1 Tax=Molorchus minor TaxID=1323400 RepID=A0ABQ9JN61_9CUCU|nr:hypothetical protein NQ317_001082 [Molorchus minor]
MKLIRELSTNEPTDFKNYPTELDEDSFNSLLELVGPKITKQNTKFRDAISAEERLIVTLRYLATGNSYEDLKFRTAISPQSIGVIVPETCWAIYEALKKEYLKVPSSIQEWQKVADDFKNMWNFENCLGAMMESIFSSKKPPNTDHIIVTIKARLASYYLQQLMQIMNFCMFKTGRPLAAFSLVTNPVYRAYLHFVVPLSRRSKYRIIPVRWNHTATYDISSLRDLLATKPFLIDKCLQQKLV